MTSQLSLLLRQLTISQRIGIAAAALASIGLLAGFAMWAGKPDLQPAFTGLATEDAAAISEALRSAKVPFEVSDAGSTILVPASQLSAARVAAGAAGVDTGGGTGFELFDQQGFGASEFDQQVTYQRALEGKLERTLEAMDGVADVTVSVVQAERGLFADQDQPASASVNLRMRNGQPPDASMVRGIVGTVTGAVAGLAPENVTVVDDAGRVLAGPDNALGGDSAAIQAGVERSISVKVQALVDQALGPGHASVAVSADLDLDRVEQEVTTVKPIDQGNWTPTSVQVVNETYGAGANGGAGGIPGSASNVPGLPTYPGLPAASASPGASPAASAAPAGGNNRNNTGYVRESQTVNYANSQTVERVIKEPGTIERLSVAVLLDQAALGSVTAEGLSQTISAAIGVDETRGDVISVSAVTFAEDAAGEAAAGSPDELISTVTTTAGSVLGALVAFILVFLVWRNLRALRNRADEMQLQAVPADRGLLESGYDASGQPVAVAPLPSFADTPQARIQERLRLVADEKPEEIVGLMNSWLREDARR
jgi:flagellar M-ring protein FliF